MPVFAAERRLKNAEDVGALAHAAILDQLAEGVIVTDEAGRITLVNAAAERLHGVGRLDVEPDRYSETYHLFTEDGRPFPPRELALARAVRGEVVSQARWRIKRPDGTEILAIGDARPLRDLEGRQTGAVLTLRDDTARDAAEGALRDLNGALAETVTQRTRDAESARLEAERASRAKSDFLASVSHELRTPLHSVLGYAELLSDHLPSDGEAARLASHIRSSGSALLGLVNDLLDLSRIEAGRLQLAAEPFSLLELAEQSLSMVRGAAESKALDLDLRGAEWHGGDVVGDAFRVRQVLVNLLSNAVKFTEQGGVVLAIAPAGGPPEARRLRFSVHDTGIGVPEGKQHLLFQRFSQVDGTSRRAHGGAGLGLAICKRLVERLGGVIGMESREGQGSTFWFELDLPPSATPHLDPKVSKRPQARARRVLLVDDVVMNQELGRLMLESAGHAVDVASGGAEAVSAVEANAYDAVFMDVHMPLMDGLCAARSIRELPSPHSGVPIVALTADVLPHSVNAALAAGMDDHVGKPFNRDTLLASLAKVTAERTRA